MAAPGIRGGRGRRTRRWRVVRVRARRRDDDDGAEKRRAVGVSRKADEVVRGLDAEQQVDQVLLLGFDGTDEPAPILAELRSASSAACSSDSRTGRRRIWDRDRPRGTSGGRIPPLIVAAQEGGIYRRSRSSRRPSARSTSATPKPRARPGLGRGDGARARRPGLQPQPLPGGRRRHDRQPGRRAGVLRRQNRRG